LPAPLPDNLERLCEPFRFDNVNQLPINPRKICKRQEGGDDECVLEDAAAGDGADSHTVTYEPGAPSPTCTNKCGTICSTYFCNPTPSGEPLGFHDPEDPKYRSNPLDLPSLTGTLDPNCPKTTSTICPPGNHGCMTTVVCDNVPLPSLTGTRSTNCEMTTRGVYVGPGREPLITTECKPPAPASSRDPSYDQPVDGKVCSNQCRLDRGYECVVDERGISAE